MVASVKTKTNHDGVAGSQKALEKRELRGRGSESREHTKARLSQSRARHWLAAAFRPAHPTSGWTPESSQVPRYT